VLVAIRNSIFLQFCQIEYVRPSLLVSLTKISTFVKKKKRPRPIKDRSLLEEEKSGYLLREILI